MPSDLGRPGGGPSLRQVAGYFLRLGALGFGGPVALANHIRRDLVERRRWLTETEYEQGLAIAAACPGPLAYQLGVYCGYVKRGIRGGLVAALAFALPPFGLVVAAAWLYTRYAGNWQLRALFYGVGPVVVALIVRACWSLGGKTLARDRRAWIVAVTACAVTVALQRELVALFLVAGALGTWLFAEPRAARARNRPARALVLPLLLASAPPAAGVTGKLFLFFFRTGLLVFGSGLVIVPFLKTYVVEQYHWLGNRAFLDAVAVGMISPGPVVISATFVGYLLDGLRGAAAATVGIFTPAVLFTVLATPLLLRYASNSYLGGFVRGISVAVVGVLVGTTYLMGKTAIGDALTIGIAAGSLLVLFLWRKLPEPFLVLAGALVGLIAYPIIQPAWVLS